jgi:hypothetical protein
VVIRFFTFQGFKAKAIHLELVSMSEKDALVLTTVKKKWSKRFSEGRRDHFDAL